VNADDRTMTAAGERAERAGNFESAYDYFVTAGDIAAASGSWRAAMRCFQRAVEIDLFRPVAVTRLAAIAGQVHRRTEWAEYATALDRQIVPRFALRGIQLVVGNAGAFVTAAEVGTLLDVLLTGDDLLEVMTSQQFAGMPLAMALLVLRRALWPVSKDRSAATMSMRVVFEGRPPPYKLMESGDWEPT
jgi:hypothetical protein